METILFGVFAVIVVLFLVVDLGYFNRQAHRVSTKSAVLQSLFWVTISVLFGGLIWALVGHEAGAEFMSAYVAEKMLSVDNLFVIMLIFSFFKVDPKYHHKVLFWGIMGAIVFRGIFIGAGEALIHYVHWILYIFGAFLVYTGFKLLKNNDDEEEKDFNENRIVKLVKKYLPFYDGDHKGKFTINIGGKAYFTTLFLVLVLIETTDIVFAFDSIPAVFSITRDPFIAYTSNILAVMGLRALFFLVEDILKNFKYLQQGLSVVLMFIGGKMLVDIFGIHISSVISFGVIIAVLAVSFLASIIFAKK